jgi:hypothetical protein
MKLCSFNNAIMAASTSFRLANTFSPLQRQKQCLNVDCLQTKKCIRSIVLSRTEQYAYAHASKSHRSRWKGVHSETSLSRCIPTFPAASTCDASFSRGTGISHPLNLKESRKHSSQRCRAVSQSEAEVTNAPPLPRTAEEQTKLAQEAMQKAEGDGVKRQRMQLLLPIDARASNFLDTEPR